MKGGYFLEIIDATNKLWDCEVIDFLYNPIQGVVKIKLINDAVHEIKFSNTNSLLFNQNPSDDFINDYTFFELNEILFDTRQAKAYKKNSVFLDMKFNVLLELTLSTVLIQAEKVEIDGMIFDLK